MAQLKDTIISGSLRVTDTIFSTNLNLSGTVSAGTWNGSTVGVAYGGTGTDSFTANCAIISGNTTTSALTTRAIYNKTSTGDLGWTAAATDIDLITKNTLAFWNGRYKDTSSNLRYFKNRVNIPTITDGTFTAGADAGSSNTTTRYSPAIWKFNASINPEDGDIVSIKVAGAAHDYGTWISLDNGSNYHPLVYAVSSRPGNWYNGAVITIRYDSTGTASVFAIGGAMSRTTTTGVWRILTMYDSGNDMGIRVYNQISGYNNDYPLLVSRTPLSTQIGTNNSNSTSTSGVYAVIWDSPNDGSHNKTPTLNPSTGMMKFLTATVQGTTPSTSTATGALIVNGGLGVGLNIYATKVYNAVWNDYAECRKSWIEEPGRVITEDKSGVMELATQRLMPACRIISDTYGTLMGETETSKTPIAVAGRVLVYPYKDRAQYQLGDAVCSAPNGTVDIMSRDEIMMYPERIIGTVSEIPEYEIWHAGTKNNPTDIEVNGRIWIYVR